MLNNSIFYKQVGLLIKVMPYVATENCFALKGGTAINLFVRDFPRLSVDIDLSYLPFEPRDVALINIRKSLAIISILLNKQGIQTKLKYPQLLEGHCTILQNEN